VRSSRIGTWRSKPTILCALPQSAAGRPPQLILSLLSWFNLYSSVRPLANSVEAALTPVVLCYWPEPITDRCAPAKQATALSVPS